MNRTKSGALSVGSPMSQARLLNELEFFVRPEGTLRRLALTEEGSCFLNGYIEFNGPILSGDNSVMEWIDTYSQDIEIERMEYACYGAMIALRMFNK